MINLVNEQCDEERSARRRTRGGTGELNEQEQQQ
jgi:hypothetical protein